jgi:hypothetical protein
LALLLQREIDWRDDKRLTGLLKAVRISQLNSRRL